MKIREGFILREVAGEVVVLPSGGDLDLNMMATLNGTGRFLWELLQGETCEGDLVGALLAEYDVDEATARGAVRGFVAKLQDNGLLA